MASPGFSFGRIYVHENGVTLRVVRARSPRSAIQALAHSASLARGAAIPAVFSLLWGVCRLGCSRETPIMVFCSLFDRIGIVRTFEKEHVDARLLEFFLGLVTLYALALIRCISQHLYY
jgi:hypothetical protein